MTRLTTPTLALLAALASSHMAAFDSAWGQQATQAHKTAKSDNPFLSSDHGTADWFSLGPRRDPLIAGAYDKDEVTNDLRANESITVYARRHHLEVPEDNRPGTTPDEAWQSDAARSYVPALGDSCDKHSVCVSPDQKGLIPSIFGSNW